jgi:hypothetical protein
VQNGKALIAVLVAGLVVGGGAVYFAGGGIWGSAKTVTTTSTIGSTGSSTQVSGIDLQAALNNTVAPNLAVTSYSFGKGTLTAWILNNGTEPYMITPHVPFLNDSTDNIASIISLDSKVVHVGDYYYVPPGSTIIVSLNGDTFATGQTGILSIYGDHWQFVYGTQKD